ncbi:MAG: hypothetical protein JWP46_4543 [Modestobacter sp.]|nr:hypothetical protein [Modestobacter sp.]
MVELGHTRGTARTAGGLTDDVLTQQPGSRTPRAYLRDAVDRLAGADPGMTQLRTALQSVLGIAVGVGLVYLFVRRTGALQLAPTAGPAPLVAAHNHALLIVSMLLAGMVAMMAGFMVSDRTARGQLVSSLLLPVPMLAAMVAGLAVGAHHLLSLVYVVVLMTVAVYVRRWGPPGFRAGMVAFNGGFLGFFLHAQIGLGDIGWLAAFMWIGVLASLLVRFTLLRPGAKGTLARMRRSWDARARRLLQLSIDALDTEDAGRTHALQERLRRQVVRLNESTLMIDAQLAETVPESAAAEAQRLFDVELALSNCARFAGAMAVTCAEPAARAQARRTLSSLLAEDTPGVLAAAGAMRLRTWSSVRTTVLAHRLAASAEECVRARRELDEAIAQRPSGQSEEDFTPAVALNAGFLPGSVPVSAAASTTPGRGGLLDRATMPAYVRSAIQIAVAGTLAVVIGNAISGQRMYWAILATFLTFVAATNAGEQVRRALFRVTGTAVGIVMGDVLVHVTGARVWVSLLVVIVALFFGIYLIRINYIFMVIGVTVTMSLLYVQFGEFSWGLLVLRLAETAIGVGAVVLTVLVIVPLRPQRVLTTGLLLWFQKLRSLVDAVLDRVVDGQPVALRPVVRELDAAYAALVATAAPLRRATFGRNSAQLTDLLAISAAARLYARSLAAQAEAEEAGEDGVAQTEAADRALRAMAEQVRASTSAIERRIETGEHDTYVRASALVELAAEQVRPRHGSLQHALRDLTLLDGALARLATVLQMEIADYDTTPADAVAEVPTMSGQRG